MSINLSNYSNEFELNLRKHWPLPIESLQYISFPFHQCVDVSLDPHRQRWEKLRTKSHRPLQTHKILTANRHRNHIQTEDRTMALTQWFRIGHLRENKTNFIIHVDKFEKKKFKPKLYSKHTSINGCTHSRSFVGRNPFGQHCMCAWYDWSFA